jgi:RNA polymerase sigma factor for flagellar operon FliA
LYEFRRFFAGRFLARAVLKKTPMPTKTTAPAKRKQPKRAPKLSRKALADRRREYAAKFFPYIEKVARRLARRLPAHVEIDDLISSGVIGLMEAAERYDPKRVDRFEAFAESAQAHAAHERAEQHPQ